jgi:hypothetical protein
LTPNGSFQQQQASGMKSKQATNSSSSLADGRRASNSRPGLNDSNTRYLNDYSKTSEGLQEIDSKLKSLQLLLKNNVI